MYRAGIVGILGVSLMLITACESMTGKTAWQTMDDATMAAIDDATMTASVQEKLTGGKLPNFSRINVTTDRSVVSLNGVVRTVGEKSAAEDLARQVAGVRNVNNNLHILSLADTGSGPGRQDGSNQMSEEVEDEPLQRIEAIKGDVLGVEGDTYFVKEASGKEVRLHTDDTTQKTGDINQGDRIEAQMNDQNHALSIRSIPTRDSRNKTN
ncbi:MAG: BON domain-containing protein [Nitrospirae bacterium]|nr:BON domain-containing protein [Nitrospirota bacterium]